MFTKRCLTACVYVCHVLKPGRSSFVTSGDPQRLLSRRPLGGGVGGGREGGLKAVRLIYCCRGVVILSYITGGAPDLQCKFENYCRPGLSRPGRPIVQFTADLDP